MDNAGSASLSQSSAGNTSLIQGLVIGFFFPVLPFFFIRKPSPPVFWEDGSDYEPPESVIFSLVFSLRILQGRTDISLRRATQLGLVIGFIANIMFGLWRFFLDASWRTTTDNGYRAWHNDMGLVLQTPSFVYVDPWYTTATRWEYSCSSCSRELQDYRPIRRAITVSGNKNAAPQDDSHNQLSSLSRLLY